MDGWMDGGREGGREGGGREDDGILPTTLCHQRLDPCVGGQICAAVINRALPFWIGRGHCGSFCTRELVLLAPSYET